MNRGALVPLVAMSLLAGAPQAFAVPVTGGLFDLVEESAVYDPESNDVEFRIVFNRRPDFFTLDAQGRQAHAFQYFILRPGVDLPYPERFASIIRGAEIHLSRDALRIRNATPSAFPEDPASGGWGTIRGAVPYRLAGNVLVFTTPLELLIDGRGANGRFRYSVETYTYGELTRFLTDRRPHVKQVPEPGSVPLLTVAGIALWAAWRRQRPKQPKDAARG